MAFPAIGACVKEPDIDETGEREGVAGREVLRYRS
jgi:hypothetical protein